MLLFLVKSELPFWPNLDNIAIVKQVPNLLLVDFPNQNIVDICTIRGLKILAVDQSLHIISVLFINNRVDTKMLLGYYPQFVRHIDITELDEHKIRIKVMALPILSSKSHVSFWVDFHNWKSLRLSTYPKSHDTYSDRWNDLLNTQGLQEV